MNNLVEFVQEMYDKGYNLSFIVSEYYRCKNRNMPKASVVNGNLVIPMERFTKTKAKEEVEAILLGYNLAKRTSV